MRDLKSVGHGFDSCRQHQTKLFTLMGFSKPTLHLRSYMITCPPISTSEFEHCFASATLHALAVLTTLGTMLAGSGANSNLDLMTRILLVLQEGSSRKVAHVGGYIQLCRNCISRPLPRGIDCVVTREQHAGGPARREPQ